MANWRSTVVNDEESRLLLFVPFGVVELVGRAGLLGVVDGYCVGLGCVELGYRELGCVEFGYWELVGRVCVVGVVEWGYRELLGVVELVGVELFGVFGVLLGVVGLLGDVGLTGGNWLSGVDGLF